MSLGWVVAALNVALGKLTGSQRAALVAMAEATPKGQRKSRITQDELMPIIGVTSRNGIDKAVRGLVDVGLVRHERARLGHPAVYHLLFDAWVYDEVAREMRPPQVTQPAGNNQGDGSPQGDVTEELRHPRGKIASPVGDPSPSTPKDPSLSVEVAVVRAAGVAGPAGSDDEKDFINWMNIKYPDRGPGWWRKIAGNGDIKTIAGTWRAERAAKPRKVQRPPWCEHRDCNRDTRMRDLDDGRVVPCEACHPDPGGALRRARGGTPLTT